MTVNVDEVVNAYLKLRNKKDAIEAETKSRLVGIKEQMSKLEAWIKIQADQQGVTSFKTNAGTAYVSTVDFANVADWDAVLSYVLDNKAYDMLEKRVSKIAVRGYIEAHKAVPAGINYGTKLEINVRKPTNRVED